MSKCAELCLVIGLVVSCSSAGAGGGTGGSAGAGAAAGAGAGGGAMGTGGSRPDGRGDAAMATADVAVPVDLAPDLPSVAFCDGYAAKFCERLRGCSPPYVTVVYGTMATCQERLSWQCRTEAVLPGGGLNGAAGQACADALVNASCDDLLGNSVSVCQIKGTLPKGAACGSMTQCQSGFCRMPETAF